MPYTPAQRRLFGAKYASGEIKRSQMKKMMHEGTRTDVDKSGHALKKNLGKKRMRRGRRSRRGGRR